MIRSRTLQVLVLLAAVASIAFSPASAEPPRQRDRTPPAAAGLWHAVTSIWEAIGCKIDPHGGCAGEAPAPPPETDIGCKIDPHGGCAPDS